MNKPGPIAPRIEVASEDAFIVYFGDGISGAVSDRVQKAARQVRSHLGAAVLELVPSYASLLVRYDVGHMGHAECRAQLDACLGKPAVEGGFQAKREVTLPVYYSAETGPDLAAMAASKGLPPEEIIRMHHAGEYRVYAIGFAPGFAFLGELDERLATPRLATPRASVPAGSVGIADRQTAVYPHRTPGGWNLIGRCPLRMFDAAAHEPMLVAVGDRVRFAPIDRARFLELGGQL